MRVAWGSAVRLARILVIFARHGLAHLLGTRAQVRPILRRWLPMAGRPAPERLRILFEDMGGTFIKFGQMLALQPDILPIEYCNALFNLLDRVEPFGFDDVERIVTEELGKPPGEIFEVFDSEPLATASVGQVHVAHLDGRKVAVKVQRPTARGDFSSDVRLMKAAIGIIRLGRLKPFYWMLEPMSEFVSWTREELDYRNEARYSEELRKHAAEMPTQYIPAVDQRFTTRRTLVVEFLDGVTLLDYLRARERGDEILLRRLDKLGFDRKRLAANVIDNFLGNAFRHGIYHADLHPANLMILKNSVVGYVDFGITGVMSPYSRSHLMVMTLGLAQGDMESLYEQFLKLSAFGPQSDLEGFRAGLDRLAGEWYEVEGRRRGLAVNFTRVMTDMLNLSRSKGVMPERDIIKYIRSAIAIDGLINRFEMDFHVGRYLEQTCARFLRWQSLRSSLSSESLLDWSAAGARLITDGALHSGRFLERLARGDLQVRAELGASRAEDEDLRSRAVLLAATVLILTFLMAATGESAQLGWNLFTAELALILAGLGMLVPALVRLS